MSLKSEREKAATRLANGEDACSHPGNIAAVDCSECGPALFARELRAAERRAMERLWQWVDETYGDVFPSEPLLNALLDEDDEA